MFQFSGKVVAVTGASGIGIGRHIAERFYLAGACAGMCSRSAERIKESALEIGGENNSRILAMQADTMNISDIQAFLQAVIDRFGRLDILINNAGVQFPKPTVDVTESDWINTMDTNLKGYFFAAQYAAKDMISRGIDGRIVNISSVHGTIVQPGWAVYTSSKAGIVQLTKSLAREWGRNGIRVNSVAPGSVPTLINREMYKDPAADKAMCEKIPLGRRGTTREIADAALYLASDYSSYVTGQTLYVDGGLSLVHG